MNNSQTVTDHKAKTESVFAWPELKTPQPLHLVRNTASL